MSTHTHHIKIHGRNIETIVMTGLRGPSPESGIKKLLMSLSSTSHVVGLDIEQSTNGSIDLLKLSCSKTCLLIQLRNVATEPFRPFLSKFLHLPEISFVGIGIKHSLDALEKMYGVRCRNAFDLGLLAADVEEDPRLRACGLVDLAGIVCGINDARVKSPSVCFGDWNCASLSAEQIKSAATDAHLAFLIGDKLLGGDG